MSHLPATTFLPQGLEDSASSFILKPRPLARNQQGRDHELHMSGEYVFSITGFSSVSQAITRSDQMMA
ncbi:hypothetical protein MC885_021564 [Smutsia gigantea]|nr:hypothetical protein MC885_021564 [Smutsia gigantea]